MVDTDTNDPFSTQRDNNTLEGAQDVVSPVLIGGFVTRNGTFQSGDQFATSGDRTDLYRVALTAGQKVVLTIADHGDPEVSPTPDLDLGLYTVDDTSAPIDVSDGLGRTESLTAPADGSYIVRVEAASGSSNYTLSIGQASGLAEAEAEVQGEFVPGQVIVRFHDTLLPANAGDALSARAAQLGLRAKAGGAGRAMLFELPQDAVERRRSLRALAAPDLGSRPVASAEAKLRLDTLMAVKALRQRADVKSADLNYRVRAFASPNDQHYPLQWHYSLINLPQAWDIETGMGRTVTVAVIDTGVHLAHPDLRGVLVPGYDFIADPATANDGDGIDNDPDDSGDGQAAGASSFHGTHVAGTVASDTNNATGVAGTSWGARIMPIRVLGVGGGNIYDVSQGVRYAAGLATDAGPGLPEPRAQIINLSLGCLGCGADALRSAIAAARERGVIIVAAAGNESTSQLSYPAAYDGVVSVGAVDLRKQLAPYSNFGSTIDLVAPGGDASVDRNGDGYPDGILSTIADDSGGTVRAGYSFLQGTSMAAPHVAGVFALMKARNPSAVTPAAIDAWIASGAITEDLGNDGAATRNNTFGYGLIDAAKALQVVSGGEAPTLLRITPSSLDFGATTSQLTLALSASGDGPIQVASVSEDAPWLSLAAPASADGLGDYTVTVDRDGLQPGDYRAPIVIAYQADGESRSATVSVSLRVPSPVVDTGAGDVGLTWFILYDPQTGRTAKTTLAENVDGRYSYAFENVPAGEYYLIGGTDSDNDGYLCDAGESCGGYPTFGQLQLLRVSGGTLSGRDFVVSFSNEVGMTATAANGQRGFPRGVPDTQVKKHLSE